MKYYINEVRTADSEWDHPCIGLFTEHDWTGEGNFCGWYAVEYYLNTTLIAYGIQEHGGGVYDPLVSFTKVQIIHKKYDKIEIGSCYWEESFEANSEEEAIKIFSEQKWREQNDIQSN